MFTTYRLDIEDEYIDYYLELYNEATIKNDWMKLVDDAVINVKDRDGYLQTSYKVENSPWYVNEAAINKLTDIFTGKKQTSKSCSHIYKHYIGLTEKYSFCVKCDHKLI